MLAVAAVLILIVGGWFLIRPKQQPAAPSNVSTPPSVESNSSASASAEVLTQEYMVGITAEGFSPKEITIKAGSNVTWTNSDKVVHTVNSAVHPTHQVYPPLNLGNIQPGDKKSLTFPTAGIYKYHDHLNPSLTGQVTVE